MCAGADLFVSRSWFAVERERVGPWVPERAAVITSGEAEDLATGLVVQSFGRDVHDETVRLDRMLAYAGWPVHTDAVLPAAMFGTWFNSRVLSTGTQSAERIEHLGETVLDAALDVARSWNCAAAVFPSVAVEDVRLRTALAKRGFIEFEAPTRHVVAADAADWEAWLAALPSRKRFRIRKELAAAHAAGVQVNRVSLTPGSAELLTVAALAMNLEARYGQRSTLRQMTDWFIAIARHTTAVVFLARMPDGTPAGMSLWIEHLDRLYGFHAGFDYGVAVGLPLYSVVGYHEPLRYALERQAIRVLEYGAGSDDAKRIRGTTPLPQVMAVRPLTAAAKVAIPPRRLLGPQLGVAAPDDQ